MREGGRYIKKKGKKPRRVEFTKSPEQAAAEKKARAKPAPKATGQAVPAPAKTKEQ